MSPRSSVRLVPPLRSFALAALLGAAGCGGDRVATDEVLDLVPHARTGTEPGQPHRVRLMAESKTHRLVFVELGNTLVFDGLDLPGAVTLTGDLQLLEIAVRTRHLLQLVVTAAGPGGETAAEVAIGTNPKDGRTWIPFEVTIEAPGPIERLALRFDRQDAHAFPDSRAVLLRPVARFHVERAPTRGEPRQVLLVTTDTLRADALGCYGNPDVRTPNLDALAAEGLRFTRAFSTANVTNPSHTSMFTSLYLKDHKVTDNFTRLSPDVPTMLEPLRAAGFATAAFVSSFNFQPEKSDLAQRFDDFFGCDTYFERRAEDVNLDAFPWLGEHADEDFFAWLHYFDAHMPYAPPYPYDRQYPREGGPRIDLPIDYKGNLKWFSASRELGYYRSQYQGEVSYLDHHLGELFDRLRALGIWDRATVVVVADHGEALGEQGVFCEHSSLFDEVTRVPLIVKPPAARADLECDTDALVSTVDLYPTVFELCDLAVPPGLRGRSVFGEGAARDRVYSTFARGAQETVRTADVRFLLGVKDEELFPRFGIRAGRRELYRVRPDGAPVDVLAEEPARASELERDLRAFLDDARDWEALPVDAAQAAEMEKLGYTQR